MSHSLPPCHHCGDTRLRPQTLIPLDRVLAVMGLQPYECLGCGSRAYRFPRDGRAPDSERAHPR